MTLATVVIPVSLKHKEAGVYHDAIQSVQQQTVPTKHIVVFDNGDGAARTRNRGTAEVGTPFVIFLDADDRLRPGFVEQCLAVYKRGTYVYTDWVVNGLIVNTPDCLHPFDQGQEHVITTLMPVIAWQQVGGFDEMLDTLEDEDYYRKLATFGWCGVRCPQPLVEYRRHLGASLVNLDAVDRETQKQRVAEKVALFNRRYRRHEHMAKDCGCFTPTPPETQGIGNEKQPNDVLVETLYTPQKVEGAMTRRLYPRAGLGKRIWVHEDDARSRPDLFRIIASNPEKVSPDVATVKRLAEEAIVRTEALEKPDFESMLRSELLAYAKARTISVIGTGKRGRVTRKDLLSALA